MISTGSIARIRSIVAAARAAGKKIILIPTMGGLHDGHLSLVRAAVRKRSFIVVSIFVNPIQFGPKEDYKNYPRSLKKDIVALRIAGAHAVFHPRVRAMYPKDSSTYVEEVSLSNHLCGISRPGHFRGVCTVVAKLFNVIAPDESYFGQKDYQQVQVIKRMVRDLGFPIRICMLPTVREKNGLAMSSRNRYLSFTERNTAGCLRGALRLAEIKIKEGEQDTKKIIRSMKAFIRRQSPSARLDYVAVCDPDTLDNVAIIGRRVLVAVAISLGAARLIDNMIIKRGV